MSLEKTEALYTWRREACIPFPFTLVEFSILYHGNGR